MKIFQRFFPYDTIKDIQNSIKTFKTNEYNLPDKINNKFKRKQRVKSDWCFRSQSRIYKLFIKTFNISQLQNTIQIYI